MRFAFTTGLLLSTLVLACGSDGSGSTSTDTDNSTASPSPTNPTPPPSATTPSTPKTPDTPEQPDGPDTPIPNQDGGSDGGAGDSGASDGGGPAPTDCVTETEANDTPETANALGDKLCFKGTVPAAGDVDHVAFVLPADAKTFGWGANWNPARPDLTITSEGVTRSLSEKPPVFPGKRYVIRVGSAGDKDVSYTVTINFTR